MRASPEHIQCTPATPAHQNGFEGKTPSRDGNLFIEQMISDRLRDLVLVKPNGEIKLNLREQMSAQL